MPDLLDELGLGQGALMSFDLIALASEDILPALVDILEQEDLDVLCLKGLKRLFLLLCAVHEGARKA